MKNMFVDFDINNEDFKVLNHLTEMDNLDLLVEECAELIQAINKYKRSIGVGCKTPITRDEAITNLNEELTDVLVCIKYQMLLTKGINLSDIDEISKLKTDRFLERLEK
jgi:mazG nucleotide pyrophosphohydrolase domain